MDVNVSFDQTISIGCMSCCAVTMRGHCDKVWVKRVAAARRKRCLSTMFSEDDAGNVVMWKTPRSAFLGRYYNDDA